MPAIRNSESANASKVVTFSQYRHRVVIERRFVDAARILKTTFDNLKVYRVHSLLGVEYRFDPHFIDRVFCDTIGMSRVGFIYLTEGKVSYSEHWVLPLEIHRGDLPPGNSSIPPGLPLANIRSIFENPLDVRGSKKHLKYVYTLYKGVIDRAFDWLAALRHHSFTTGSKIDYNIWKALLTEGSCVEDVTSSIRAPLNYPGTDSESYLLISGVKDEVIGKENFILGLNTMFMISRKKPALSIDGLAKLIPIKPWIPGIPEIISNDRDATPKPSGSGEGSCTYSPITESGPVYFQTPILSASSRSEYTPWGPYFTSNQGSEIQK